MCIDTIDTINHQIDTHFIPVTKETNSPSTVKLFSERSNAYLIMKKTRNKNLHTKYFKIDIFEKDSRELAYPPQSLSELKDAVSIKVGKLGFSEWAYTRLDTINKLAAKEVIGTINRNQISRYIEGGHYRWDIMLDSLRSGSTPLFQSQVAEQIENIGFFNEIFENYKNWLSIQYAKGHNDSYCIPLACKNSNGFHGKFLFAVTSKGFEIDEFKNRAQNNSKNLSHIGKTLNEVGTELFPEYFIASKIKHDDLISSHGFEILIFMTQKNLSEDEASKHFNISRKVLVKELLSLKCKLNASTNHGAYQILDDSGYTSPTSHF
jgi:predicted DNA-binding protein (UPF0251 family)